MHPKSISLLCAAALLVPLTARSQDELRTSITQFETGGQPFNHVHTGPGPTLSDSDVGPRTTRSIFTSFGASNAAMSGGMSSGSSQQILSGVDGKWHNTWLITPADPALN